MKLKDLITIISSASKEAMNDAFGYVDINAEKLSKAQAYKRYGRASVDRWLSEGLIELIGKKLSTEQLAAVASKSNRLTYKPVLERKQI